MLSTLMSRSGNGPAPEPLNGPRRPARPDAVEEQALVAAAMLLTAAGYRVDPMPPAVPAETAPGDLPALTARERQVVSLLVEGASNKLIARRLDISVHPAKFHVAAVVEKLDARNRSDAVAIALRDGLVAL